MLKKILSAIVIIIGMLLAADALLIWGIAHTRPTINHADSIIVLGAAINTPSLTNRTEKGLQLYQRGKADVMVLSGGQISEDDISEPEYMEKIIKRDTDQPVNYILENESHSTYDNIKNSKAKLQENGKGTDSVIIVSDAYHLARAVLLAKREGFKHVYWSAPSSHYYSHDELRYYYIREFLAMINYIPKFIKG